MAINIAVLSSNNNIIVVGIELLSTSGLDSMDSVWRTHEFRAAIDEILCVGSNVSAVGVPILVVLRLPVSDCVITEREEQAYSGLTSLQRKIAWFWSQEIRMQER